MIWIRNTDLSFYKKLRRFWDDKWVSQLMLDANAISSTFLMPKWTYFAVFLGIQGLFYKIQALLLQIQGVFKKKIIFKEFSRT